MAGVPAVAPGGRGSTGPRVSFPDGRGSSSWSARCQVLQSGDRGGDLDGPGPSDGEAQPQAAPAADDVSGDGEQPQPQSSGFPGAGGPSRASICIQAVSSQAIATSSHQIW